MAGAELLFWISLLLFYLPLCVRLLSVNISRFDRLIHTAVLGGGVYLLSVIGQPLHLIDFAELDQLRTVNDIVRTHHLFTANPIGQVNPFYPALSEVTNAVSATSGLSTFCSAILIVLLSRLLLVVCLFLIVETLTRSGRVAGITVALYATNPDFLTFSTQFSYETLALGLLFVVLLSLAVYQAAEKPQKATIALSLILVPGLVLTHHVTSIALVAISLAWTLIAFVVGRAEDSKPKALTVFALFSTGCTGGWLAWHGRPALPYLSDILGPALTNLAGVLTGRDSTKVPFKASSGVLAPAWERFVGFGSIAIILIALPFAVFIVWKRYRRRPAVLTIAALSLIYIPSLALRLTQAGTETSNRSSDFIFIGISVAIAALVCTRLLPRPEITARPTRYRWRLTAIAVCATVMFVGGITIGTQSDQRQPGPYIVGADDRSVSPEGLTTASWMLTHLGSNNAMLTDRSNRQLVGSYGDQNPLTKSGGPMPDGSYVHISVLESSPTFSPDDQAIIRNRHIKYLEIDQRLSTSLPLIGIYFEISEPDAYHHHSPIPLSALEKFNSVPGARRIYDAGVIQLYDLAGVR